jgi:hypothetical protein
LDKGGYWPVDDRSPVMGVTMYKKLCLLSDLSSDDLPAERASPPVHVQPSIPSLPFSLDPRIIEYLPREEGKVYYNHRSVFIIV